MFWGGEKERRKKTERGEGHFIAGHSSPGHVYLIRRGTRKNTPSFLWADTPPRHRLQPIGPDSRLLHWRGFWTRHGLKTGRGVAVKRR